MSPNLLLLLKEFIELEIRTDRPDISNTKEAKKANNIRSEFFTALEHITPQLYKRRLYELSRESKVKLYKLFYIEAQRAYFAGQEYADRESGTEKPVTISDLEKINKIARKALARYLAALK